LLSQVVLTIIFDEVPAFRTRNPPDKGCAPNELLSVSPPLV
jgi:hypothetical protein